MWGFFYDIIFLSTKHLAENIYFAFLDTKDLLSEKQVRLKIRGTQVCILMVDEAQ